MKKLLLLTGSILFLMGGPRAQSISPNPIAEARKLLYYERYDGAARQLQTILKAEPANTEAWWLLTQTYLHQNRLGAIKDTLQFLPAAAAGQPFALCIRGQLSLEQNQKDSAEAYFSKALALTKEKDPIILQAIAKAHQDADSGNAQYALSLLDIAAKRDKHNPDLYTAEGDAYRKLQDGGQAFKAYQEALNQDGKYAKALYKQGKIFLTQNNAEQYLKYFNDAVAADSAYAPAWYELYYHYYFRDVNKAAEYLNHYIANTDPGIQNDYLVTDLLYSSRKYNEAIAHAQQLLKQQNSEPRLYKLIAYSYKELHDSTKALDFMQQYFQKQSDSSFVVKDYETMAEIYESLNQADSAAPYFIKAASKEQDSTKRIAYTKKLADLYKKEKNYSQQALWLGQYYQGNAKATNLDLFNWGLAHYMAKEYPLADSVFGLYETKYPDQDFGYYWRARSDVAIDTAMQTGMAIPHYEKLIEIAEKDTANKTNRKHLIESYGYIAAYKANTQKQYDSAIAYFEKLLTLEPGNSDAQRYIAILKKTLSKTKGSTPSGTAKTESTKTEAAKADAKTEDK